MMDDFDDERRVEAHLSWQSLFASVIVVGQDFTPDLLNQVRREAAALLKEAILSVPLDDFDPDSDDVDLEGDALIALEDMPPLD